MTLCARAFWNDPSGFYLTFRGESTSAPQWRLHQQSIDGTLEFNTEIAVTGEMTAESAQNAICRLFAWHFISKLSDTALIDACEYLADTLSTQRHRESLEANPVKPEYLWTSKLEVVEHKPGGLR